MRHPSIADNPSPKGAKPVKGQALRVGAGFTGSGFRHTQFDGTMDPLILVDHYTMTAPTFGAHPHAGIAAVSVLFEDTRGAFNNRDSLGNDFDIHAGDLYWLNAGHGAIHDEAPRHGARIHGLQIFVNLPARLKHQAPTSLHVKRESMPTLTGPGYRVRLVLGDSNGVTNGATSLWPVTILDGFADHASEFEQSIQSGVNTWLYAVAGGIEYNTHGVWCSLKAGEAVTIAGTHDLVIKVRGVSAARSHYVLIAGKSINETFVHQGPFVMSSQRDIDKVIARYDSGELGHLG